MRNGVFLLTWIFALVLAAESHGQIADASIDDLIVQLKDDSIDRRRDAAYELAGRQNGSEEVVLAFANAISDSDVQVRFQALMGLARIANSAAPAIPQLIEALDNRDDQVRFRAADALGKIGTPALQPLIEAWPESAERKRIAIAQSLSLLGPSAQSARQLLEDSLDDASVNLAAAIARSLVVISPDDEALILRLCNHADTTVRQLGIESLASVTSPSSAAVDAFKASVHDVDAKIRETAIIAASKSHLSDSTKEDLLEQGLCDLSDSVRLATLVALRKANLKSNAFLSRIANRLANAEPFAVNSLMKGISLFGESGKDALPSVIEAIEHQVDLNDSGFDREQAISTLAAFGSSVVPDLLRQIEQRPQIESVLARALARIGEPALPSLLEGMQGESELIRLASTRAIGSMRELDQVLTQRLVQSVSDPSPKVRGIAVELLVTRGEPNETLKEILLAATKDSDFQVRATSISVIGKFDLSDQQAKQILDSALADQAAVVRASALAQLLIAPQQQTNFYPNILTLTDDSDPEVRAFTARVIGTFDPPKLDMAFTDALVKLMRDRDASVSIAATISAGNLKIESSQVFDVLAESFTREPDVAATALDAVASYGQQANSLIEPLNKTLTHTEPNIRVAAVNALAEVCQDRGRLTDALIPVLDDPERNVRQIAAARLGKLGPDAIAATPKLFSLLIKDEDSDFASSALKEIDAAPVEATELLMEHLDSEERRVAFYAITLLGKIGPPAKAALPKLEKMLDDRNGGREFRRRFLEEAIARIKGEPQS